MKPMKDLILIELNAEEKEKKTDSGLFLAAPRWGKPENIGKVLSIGPDVTTVKEGEYYMINRYAVRDTEQLNVKLAKEQDFLCHITDKKG